jgi:hypothetical protein
MAENQFPMAVTSCSKQLHPTNSEIWFNIKNSIRHYWLPDRPGGSKRKNIRLVGVLPSSKDRGQPQSNERQSPIHQDWEVGQGSLLPAGTTRRFPLSLAIEHATMDLYIHLASTQRIIANTSSDRSRGVTSPQPRERFLDELEDVIKHLQNQGNAILVMLDANDILSTNGSLAKWVGRLDLHDVHSSHPAPSIFLSRDPKLDVSTEQKQEDDLIIQVNYACELSRVST